MAIGRAEDSVDSQKNAYIHMYVYEERQKIGARIRMRRKQLDLTQSDLAEALGHSSCHRINQIELGRLRLYAEELPKLCKKLGCDLSDIIS